MRLVFTAEARADLMRIGDFIGRDNPRRAISFVDELEGKCALLLTRPKMYAILPNLQKTGIRRAVHGNYLIFYRIDPDRLTVLHVLSGSMDYEAVLFPDS